MTQNTEVSLGKKSPLYFYSTTGAKLVIRKSTSSLNVHKVLLNDSGWLIYMYCTNDTHLSQSN